ncbi:MAG: hypothetical protein HOV79_29430 [Hamadaea sp.]|nr:hypothetical protein [Hamadaea sp.]
MSTRPPYAHYPHSRPPRTGKVVAIVLAVLVAFVCCCGVGMFIAFEPAETARIVKSVVGGD